MVSSRIANEDYRRAVCLWIEAKKNLPSGTVSDPEFDGWPGTPAYSEYTPPEAPEATIYFTVQEETAWKRYAWEIDRVQLVALIVEVGEYL
jgi:hypothetical protein